MSVIEDYVANIEGTCGQEGSVIVTFKYDKKDEALGKIQKKAQIKNSISGVILELIYRGFSFRVFPTGKAIFSSVPSKEVLKDILRDLLQ